MARTYTIYNNNFAKGISSDPMVWPQGSYHDSENMYNDVSIWALVLNWQVYSTGTTIWWDVPYFYVPFIDNEWFLTWSSFIMWNGKVRDPAGILLFTLDQATEWSAIKHWDKILWKQWNKIHTTNLDGTWYTANVYTLTGAVSYECYLSYNNDLYIGSGNKVFVLSVFDTNGTFTSSLEVRTWDTIIWLHRIGMYIYVVTNNNVYIRQWTTSAPEYVIPWDYNIVWSWVYNNTLYTISSQAKYFYVHVLNGSNLELMIKSNWYIWDKRLNVKSIFWRNSIIEKDHWLYRLGNNTIYRLSSPWAGMPVGITKENISIWSNYRINGSYIFDTTNSKYYLISENRVDNAKNQWYIELHPHTDGVVGQKKNAQNIRVSYELDTNSLLVVSTKRNQNKDLYYAFFCEYDSAITLPTVWAVYRLWTIDLTVVAVTEKILGAKRHIIIETQAIGSWSTNNTITNTILNNTTTTITKQSGTWESTISFVYFSEYKIKAYISDDWVWSRTIQLKSEEYFIYQLRIDLLANDTRPKLYDVTYWYGNIERDI